jgi:hypothetical protein
VVISDTTELCICISQLCVQDRPATQVGRALFATSWRHGPSTLSILHSMQYGYQKIVDDKPGWRYIPQHMNNHLREGEMEEPRPDLYHLQHLRQGNLVDGLDLEKLLVEEHRLASPPLSRS